MEQNDRTMLLVAEPGMGKSTFLSYLEYEIKKFNPSVWVLRINLHEYTRALEYIESEQECIEKCKTFLWNVAHAPEQNALMLVEKIFKQALEQTGKIVILLDGFDEISPGYSSKVERLIREIRDKTSSNVWVSSRFYYRQNLEDIVMRLAFTLQPFKPENQIQFLEQYWNEVIPIPKQENLLEFAKMLLNLCSQNLSDKEGEFTGIPLHTMMLGEAFLKEAEEYYTSGTFKMPEKFNSLDLFRKFTEKKFYIYFREKNAMDNTKPEVKKMKKFYLEEHKITALRSLFSQDEISQMLGERNARGMENVDQFLYGGEAEQFGIITHTTDGKPHFIHRRFAEYFAAKWFTDNFTKREDIISDILFNTAYEVTRNIFDRILAKDSEIHGAVLNNDISSLEELLRIKTDINILDKGGRTALHLAASYNSPFIQRLLSFPGVNANKPDAVLKWTPLRYADRTKSWMAMDVLLQNGANPDDMVLTRRKFEAQEWGQTALWECASKGHRKLLEFMLNCGTDVNAIVSVPENLHKKSTLLHIASCYSQLEIIRLLAERRADINMRNANNDTALHLAAASCSVDIFKLLIDRGMSVNLTNIDDFTPLHVSAEYGNRETTKILVEKGADLNTTNVGGNTPLMLAAYKGNLEVFRYLTEIGADINIPNAKNDTALLLVAASRSVDIIKLLLDKGMPVNLTNIYKFTPLHVSAEFGNLETTKFLVENGAALNNTDVGGNTPLMVAAYKGNLEVFRYLIEIQADINIHNKDDDSALHFAARSDSVDIIKLLLDKGMSVNLTNTEGNTPLHVACAKGSLKATKYLVERDAALNGTDKYDNTPLMLAALNSKTEVFCYLTEMGADINNRNNENDTVLHLAARSDNVGIIKLLLDQGMSIDLTNIDDNTPLHVSATYEKLEASKYLVERGAAVNSTNISGNTPLMLAALNRKIEVFLYLTEIGADIDVLNNENDTALHLAARSDSVGIIELLLDQGMSINLTNINDNTPLHVSVMYEKLEASKYLVERGAALNDTNKYGNTPLMLAALNEKQEVFRYLTEKGAEINQEEQQSPSFSCCLQ
jgi:ankyrin repeat protein